MKYKYETQIEKFCEINRIEHLANALKELVLEERGRPASGPRSDIDSLLHWAGTRQGHNFWEVIQYERTLSDRALVEFVKTLSKFKPVVRDIKVFDYDNP